jgi:hypothetical protein
VSTKTAGPCAAFPAASCADSSQTAMRRTRRHTRINRPVAKAAVHGIYFTVRFWILLRRTCCKGEPAERILQVSDSRNASARWRQSWRIQSGASAVSRRRRKVCLLGAAEGAGWLPRASCWRILARLNWRSSI